MILAALLTLAVSAPTPIGVVVRADGGEAAKLEEEVRATLQTMLASDRRFVQTDLPELPDPKLDLEGARAAMSAGRDAFLILEAKEAKAHLKKGTAGLLLASDALPQRTELLDAFAQRMGILMQLGDTDGARAVAQKLASLDGDYRPEGVEFVTPDALALLSQMQRRAAKAKSGRLVVKVSKRAGEVKVRIDGEERGVAPLKATLKPGPHVVTFHAAGATTTTKVVKVRSKKTARVTAKVRRAAPNLRPMLARLEPSLLEFQEPMAEIAGALGDPPEVLFVTLGPRDAQTLDLRLLRVQMEKRQVYGKALAPVAVNGSDLDDALLFSLEEVLLGERTGADSGSRVAAAPASPTESSASSSATANPVAPEEDSTSGGAAGRDPSSPEEVQADGAPSLAAGEQKASGPDQPGASAIPETSGSTAGSAAGADPSASISEADEGSSVWGWGVAGAAAGGGVVAAAIAAAAITTAIVVSQSNGSGAPEDVGRDPHVTGTRFTVTGIAY